MTAHPKAAQQEALKLLRDRRASVEVSQLMKLLGLLLEEAKDKLVTCDPVTFVALQGEAKTYTKLIKLITRPDLDGTKE